MKSLEKMGNQVSYWSCHMDPHGVSQDSAQSSQTKLSPVKKTLQVSLICGVCFLRVYSLSRARCENTQQACTQYGSKELLGIFGLLALTGCMHKHLDNVVQMFSGWEVTKTWCWEVQDYSRRGTAYSKAAEPKQVNSANLH